MESDALERNGVIRKETERKTVRWQRQWQNFAKYFPQQGFYKQEGGPVH